MHQTIMCKPLTILHLTKSYTRIKIEFQKLICSYQRMHRVIHSAAKNQITIHLNALTRALSISPLLDHWPTKSRNCFQKILS